MPPDQRQVARPVRCLLEHGQYALLRLVGMGQHGHGGLRDDLREAEVLVDTLVKLSAA